MEDKRPAAAPEFTEVERRAIALTLLDLDGWGTLHGEAIHFDVHTGEPLPEPIRTVCEYDRVPRRGLPDGWPAMFIRQGWLDQVQLGNGWTVWRPTEAGKKIRNEWLPNYLKESS